MGTPRKRSRFINGAISNSCNYNHLLNIAPKDTHNLIISSLVVCIRQAEALEIANSQGEEDCPLMGMAKNHLETLRETVSNMDYIEAKEAEEERSKGIAEQEAESKETPYRARVSFLAIAGLILKADLNSLEEIYRQWEEEFNTHE